MFQTGLGAPARVLQQRPGDLHPGEHLELTRFLSDALRRSDLIPRLREAPQEHEGLRADVESARSRAVAHELLAQHVVRSDFFQDPRRPLERRPALARVEMSIRWQRPNRRTQFRITAIACQECVLAIASVVPRGTRNTEAHEAVPADQQRQRGTITMTLHESTPLGERGRGLLFTAAHPPADREDLVARMYRQIAPLAGILHAGDELANAPPVSQRFARVREAGPLRRVPMPPRRLARGALLVPVPSDLRGALVEVATRLRDRLGHRRVQPPAARAAASAARPPA